MKKILTWKELGLIALIAVCTIIWVYVGFQVYNAERNHAFTERDLTPRQLLIRHRLNMHPHDASFIQSWMTFDFINKAYNLPPTYLKEKLSITSPEYPKITLKKYAALSNQSSATFLTIVKTTVQNYLTTGQ